VALLDVTRWPLPLLLAGAGLSAVGLAFVTVNLFAHAMANLAFLGRHGQIAVEEGALVQLAWLAAWGLVALALYLIFKICEAEIVFRYFKRVRRVDEGMAGRRQLRFRRNGGEDA
jgi:hypothetical protein